MLSLTYRACSRTRLPVAFSQNASLPRAACTALSGNYHAWKLGQVFGIQRRDYAALPAKRSKLEREASPTFRKDGLEEQVKAKDKSLKPNDAYTIPETGLMSYLPKSWIPYAELARLDKPTGTMYLFWPCVFSTILARSMSSPDLLDAHLFSTVTLFLAGAFIMRGAGCTINDLWDRNLDPHVERTKFRPIARGAVTPLQGTVFLSAQLLVGLGILLQFPTLCLYYGIPSLLLVGTYPLAKRVTNYPQFVLGLTFSWGAIMGFPAMGIDLLADTNALYAAAALYASCVAWTVNYDMVYAHMDIKDDVKAGIKSIALAHEHNTMAVLRGLAATQAALLATSCYLTGVPWVYLTIEGIVLYLALDTMRSKLDLKSVNSCLWYFKNCATVVGLCVSCCLLFNFLVQDNKLRQRERSLSPASELSSMPLENAGPPG